MSSVLHLLKSLENDDRVLILWCVKYFVNFWIIYCQKSYKLLGGDKYCSNSLYTMDPKVSIGLRLGQWIGLCMFIIAHPSNNVVMTVVSHAGLLHTKPLVENKDLVLKTAKSANTDYRVPLCGCHSYLCHKLFRYGHWHKKYVTIFFFPASLYNCYVYLRAANNDSLTLSWS